MSHRIMLVINSLVQGGAQKSVVMLASELKKNGNEVQILTFYPEDTDFFSVPQGIEIKRFIQPFHDRTRLKRSNPFIRKIHRLTNRFQDLIAIRKVIKAYDPHLVISFESSTSVIAFFATIKVCPLLISERVHPGHHVIEKWAQILRPLVYRSKRSFLHCQGAEIAKWLEDEYKKRVIVIPNFIDQFEPKLWNASSRKIKIFSRYSPQKGIDLAIEAWSLLPKNIQSNYTLEIYGDGDRSRYENLVAQKDLVGLIKLFGPTKSMKDELKDCLVYLMPSRYEGFPNALAEAMNFGIPSVATDCPSAIRDLTLNGKLVELAEITPTSISNKIEYLLTDRERLIDLSNQGTKIQGLFPNANSLSEWAEYINWIVDGHEIPTVSCRSCFSVLRPSTLLGYRTNHGIMRELFSQWKIDIRHIESMNAEIIFAYQCRNCNSVCFSGSAGDSFFYDACYLSSEYSRKNYWEYENIIKSIQPKLAKVKVLDFGGGMSPLIQMNSATIDLTIIDLSEQIRERLNELRVKNFASLEGLGNGASFDVIVVSHVIEHVDNPSELIRQLHGLLAPQGKLFVTTPDGTTPGLLDSSLAWPPHHMIAFSPKALRDLMKSAEFSNLEVFRNPNLADAAFDFLVVGTN